MYRGRPALADFPLYIIVYMYEYFLIDKYNKKLYNVIVNKMFVND